jgi:hypothetical protein
MCNRIVSFKIPEEQTGNMISGLIRLPLFCKPDVQRGNKKHFTFTAAPVIIAAIKREKNPAPDLRAVTVPYLHKGPGEIV